MIEGLHPFFDDRVADLCDFKIYLDISDEVKFAWKIQRDMAERGHSLESIQASIEARKPDFDAYIDPQKQKADVIIQVRHLIVSAAATARLCETGVGVYSTFKFVKVGLQRSRCRAERTDVLLALPLGAAQLP